MRPSLSLPPDENWRGTRPSQAAKSRPHRKFSIGGAKRPDGQGGQRSNAGDCLQAPRRVGFSPASALILPARASISACHFFGNLFQQISALTPRNQSGQVTVGLRPESSFRSGLDLLNPLRNDVAVFIEVCSEGVDQFGALVDEPFSSPNKIARLCCSTTFGSDKAHLRPLGRDHNRLRVRRTSSFFCRLTNGLAEHRGAIRFDVMAEPDQLTGPRQCALPQASITTTAGGCSAMNLKRPLP